MMTTTTKLKHECSVLDAPKFAKWIAERGGVARWQSHDLSNPGKSYSTPALTKEGTPTPSPHWACPVAEVFTDPADITVYSEVEVEHFPVRTKISGHMLVLTDASDRKVNAALERVGKGSFYRFDYENGPIARADTVRIFRTQDLGTLKEYIEGRIKS